MIGYIHLRHHFLAILNKRYHPSYVSIFKRLQEIANDLEWNVKKMVKSLSTIKQKIKVKFFVEDCTYVGLALNADNQNKVATQLCLFFIFFLHVLTNFL